ncbi:MAG: DUF3962 domain-containing protein [Hormoscilla sp. GM7CHS1pb]|nr:DUF3962 domain-containing protein [Hormoscilla sp. GM7CHS1pb]
MTETTLPAKTLYIPLGNPKGIAVMPLAFTVPDDLPPVTVEGFTLAWTKTALLNLAEIQKATITKNNRDKGKSKNKGKNLPYGSLRSLLEIGLDNAARIHSDLGLSFFALHGKNNNEPEFAYLSGGRADTIRRTLRPILNDWITNFLTPFAEREEAPEEAIDRLLDLQESEDLLEITPLRSQILPWRWSKETGTTRPRDNYDYRVLVDYVARAIAGQEIFRGLGPMKRIISSRASFRTGSTELITDPITLEGVGKFSLVLQLELVTYPSLHQPLLKIDVSKRRWLNQLKDPGFDFGKISGFVFNTSYADRAFLYYVLCQQKKNESKRSYQTDQDFQVLRRKLLLPMKTSEGGDIDGQEIALGKASTESSQVLLTYRNGLQNEKHNIKVGVPEIDKLEAFEAIVGILKPLGFQAFDAYTQVKFKRGTGHKIDEDTVSRRINLPTLLSAALENAEGTVPSDCQAQYINELNERELDSKLEKNFDINLDQIKGGRNALTSKSDQINELKKLIERNKEAIGHLHSQEQPILVIFYEDDLQADVKLLQAIVRVLWGETIKVMKNRLPQNTHGPRKLLPGASLKGQARSQQRIEAWKSIAEQIAKQPKTFCLIMAKIFYCDSEDENAIKKDDRVNKPSTRQALARAGACVQFIQPIEKNKKNKLELENFLFRVQASLEDLLLAHSGYIHKVQEKVDKWLGQKNKPKEIIAITIVRKQKGRTRGRIEQTFLPIATRIKVETGECELCCAYERGNSLEVSPWRKFSDALGAIAQISPVKLADKEDKVRFVLT